VTEKDDCAQSGAVVPDRIAAAAVRLHQARVKRRPIAPLSCEWSDLSEAGAYAIQAATASLIDEPTVGFKLGYTSAATRLQMKVNTPNYGVLFESTRVEADGLIKFSDLIHPMVEPEIALILSRDVTDDVTSRSQALGVVDAVMPALEIVDTRYERNEISSVDNIADNSSAARFVLGTPRSASALGELRLITGALWSNGRTVAQGVAADVMGDPLNALAWFISRGIRDGLSLRAGSIVLTGGLTAAQPAKRGSAFVADFGTLGVAKCYFR
jgi:2-keto-4-pentenoate hydratase